MRISKVLACLCAVCIVTPTVAHAQGEYLWGSNSGWQLGAGATGGTDVTAYRGGVGYSFYGIIDFGMTYGVDNAVGYTEPAGGAQLTLWALKEGRRGNPLSLGVVGNFENQIHANSGGFGLTLIKRIEFKNSQAFLLPMVNVTYWSIGRLKYRYLLGNLPDHTTSGTFGIGLTLPLASKCCLSLSAHHTVTEGGNSSGGMLSIVFGRFGKE